MTEKPTYEELLRRLNELERAEAARQKTQKQAEKALRRSEAHYRTLINTIPDLVWLKDLQGVYLSCNRMFEQFFGATEAEIVGKTDYDFKDKQLADFFREHDRKAIEAGSPSANEEWLTFADNDYYGLFETIKVPMHDEDGHIIGVLGIARDITARKKAEDALKENEQRYVKAQRMGHVGNWEYDLTTDKFWGSDEAKRLYGFDPQSKDFTTDEVESRIPERKRVHQAMVDLIEKDKPYDIEFEIQPANGPGRRIIHSIAEVIKDDAGIPIKVAGVIQDLTERKRTEEKLRQSEEKYRRIAENISDVVWIMGLDMQLSYVSPSVEKMVGEPVAAYMNRTLEERFTPESMEKIHAIFSEELEKEKDPSVDKNRSREIELEHYRADGSKFWISINTSFVRDDNGIPVGIQGVSRDITERKQAGEAQRKLQEQLAQAQKMESVGRLAGGVAHDFNNMLSVILGHAELALEELPPDHPVYDDLTEIDGAGRRSAALVRQLLAFARKQTIVPQILDLNETVEGMLKMLRRLIGENIDLAWQPGHQLWPVRMDPSQIDQILANLCVNARDAIDGTGSVTIETRNVNIGRKQMDQYSFLAPGDYILLTVTDDGRGMDPETLPHLFEPFFTTKEIGRGTGLGLATIYGIVKQNRGFITADSAQGRGTVFRIYLPRHGTAVPKEQDRPDSVPHAPNHETVLLVEDEPSILKLGKSFLERLGYRVFTASRPEDALRLAREYAGDIHLLMTDVIMPEMNGRDLSEKLKSLYPNLNVLFMSGYTANVIAHHGVLEEGVAFIQKPFSRAELAVKVRKALSK